MNGGGHPERSFGEKLVQVEIAHLVNRYFSPSDCIYLEQTLLQFKKEGRFQ